MLVKDCLDLFSIDYPDSLKDFTSFKESKKYYVSFITCINDTGASVVRIKRNPTLSLVCIDIDINDKINDDISDLLIQLFPLSYIESSVSGGYHIWVSKTYVSPNIRSHKFFKSYNCCIELFYPSKLLSSRHIFINNFYILCYGKIRKMGPLNYSFSEFLDRNVEDLLIDSKELNDKLSIVFDYFKNKEL